MAPRDLWQKMFAAGSDTGREAMNPEWIPHPCSQSYALEQDSPFAQVAKEANRHWDGFPELVQHPKCLVGGPLSTSQLCFPNCTPSINPCVGTQDVAVGVGSKP